MPRSGTVVVTDSAAALPSALQSRYEIVVIPLMLEIDGAVFTEGVNISPPRVVAALLGGARVRVLEPPSGEIGRIYRGLAADGADHIVSVHVSAPFTPSWSTRARRRDTPPFPLTSSTPGQSAWA
jgi:fatty acid-binding protein DegV